MASFKRPALHGYQVLRNKADLKRKPVPTTSTLRPQSGCTDESAPETGALPFSKRSEHQAASLAALASRSLLELVIGIARGFIASGISRTRSTCKSPFSRRAPFTST